MNAFKHEVPNVESIVNAVITNGVFDGRQVNQGTLVIYKDNRLTVVGLDDGFGGAREVVLKDGEAVVKEAVSKFAVEQQRVEFKPAAASYIG